MVKDVFVVSDMIIPSLLEWLIINHVREKPSSQKDYTKAQHIIKEQIDHSLKGASSVEKVRRRANRIVQKLINYMAAHKFDTREGFIACCAWGLKLLEEEGIVCTNNMVILLHDMEEIFENGDEDNG